MDLTAENISNGSGNLDGVYCVGSLIRSSDEFYCEVCRDRCVATHFEKITHFEKNFQSALNLGPNQRTLNFFSNCVKFGTNLSHFEIFFFKVR